MKPMLYRFTADTPESHQSLALAVDLVLIVQALPHRLGPGRWQRPWQRLPALPSRRTLKGCSGTKPLKRLLLQLLASL